MPILLKDKTNNKRDGMTTQLELQEAHNSLIEIDGDAF